MVWNLTSDGVCAYYSTEGFGWLGVYCFCIPSPRLQGIYGEFYGRGVLTGQVLLQNLAGWMALALVYPDSVFVLLITCSFLTVDDSFMTLSYGVCSHKCIQIAGIF